MVGREGKWGRVVGREGKWGRVVGREGKWGRVVGRVGSGGGWGRGSGEVVRRVVGGRW